MQNYLIKNISIVNEGLVFNSDLLIKNGRIEQIAGRISTSAGVEEINGEGLHLLPGCIDDQVHFREPGLTHKADIHSESRAAVAGGITSFMEMPNTLPPAFTQELLEDKYAIASASSLANYSFYMGTSNDNLSEALRTNEKKKEVCGIKIFMGSSTGNLLVDNYLTLDKLFAGIEVLIATHCEDENIIRRNLQRFQSADRIPVPADHPVIRNEEACFQSSLTAIQFAKKHGSRLHVFHLSTEKEMQLFSNLIPLAEKRITAEVCVHHLHFTADDYGRKGNLIKCNPAIKEASDRAALLRAVAEDRVDVLATDHAPHTWEEKQQRYIDAPSGLPLVQDFLVCALQKVREGHFSLPKLVQKICHAPAQRFDIAERGFLREGYFADLTLVDPRGGTEVTRARVLAKCGWTPFDGERFSARVASTWVNGELAWDGERVVGAPRGQRLRYAR
jgi:dihydroorotase